MVADTRPGEYSIRQSAIVDSDGIEFKIEKVADIISLVAHDLVVKGLPTAVADEMTRAFRTIDRVTLLHIIGVSERTLQRCKTADTLLDSNASDRMLRLAIVTEQAIDVFGSQQAAERWLIAQATGLGMRRPIDLIQSSAGTRLVTTLLTRIDYSVYT
jgi:putative toxin-antitoxin system antitoxin component (TIGR02293 family)